MKKEDFLKLEFLNESGCDLFFHTEPQNRFHKKLIKTKEYMHQEKSLVQENHFEFLDSVSNLDDLKRIVYNFEGCALKKYAINTVFADGNPNAKIMLIGEAPGANEDETGIPFCGRSGKLLDNILLSIGLDRTSVYITNTIFWRPPGNRRPTDEEVASTRPLVEKHIQLINPNLIIMVGSTALVALFPNVENISKIRGSYFKYKNRYLSKEIDATAIFHPSYLLRQPIQKKTMWYDMLSIKRRLASYE